MSQAVTSGLSVHLFDCLSVTFGYLLFVNFISTFIEGYSYDNQIFN